MLTAMKTTIGEPSEHPWRQSSTWLVMTGGGEKRQAIQNSFLRGPLLSLRSFHMMTALGGSMHISLTMTWPDTIGRGEMAVFSRGDGGS